MMAQNGKTLIVIPAYNESPNIARTVEEVRQALPSAHVLVIDDGSADATVDTARRAGVDVIALPFNIGVGGAVQTGLQYALRGGFEVVVRVDADGQHDPAFISDLIKPVRDNRADMVIGSRFLPPHLGDQSSFIRRIGIQFFSRLISCLVGITVCDPTSGFMAFNRKMICWFANDFPHDFPEPEAIVMAKRGGGRIIEVPVQMRKRAAGQSSIRYLITFYYMIKVTTAILLHMLRQKKEVRDYEH